MLRIYLFMLSRSPVRLERVLKRHDVYNGRQQDTYQRTQTFQKMESQKIYKRVSGQKLEVFDIKRFAEKNQ